MNKFLLLFGPSGVGKSTVIRELREKDERFTYISPYITRPLREGEKDKISISDGLMDEMDAKGEFLVVNHLYGIRYATPKKPIIDALDAGKFPILDWPIQKVDVMTETFPGRLYNVYVYPSTNEELKRRIDKDGRDIDGSRLRVAEEELDAFRRGEYDGFIDLKIESTEGKIPEMEKIIYSRYLESVGEIGQKKEQRW